MINSANFILNKKLVPIKRDFAEKYSFYLRIGLQKFSKVSLVSLFFLRWLKRWFNLIVLITDKSILALKCHHYVVTSSENFNRRMGREFFIKNLQALITRFFTHAIY